MATCNFWTMEKFPLVVMGDEEACKYYIGDEDAYGETINEYNEHHISSAWLYFEEDLEYGELGELLDDLNESLKWYKVEVKSGYYSGVQFYIDTEWVEIGEKDYFGNDIWDDDETYLQFDMSLEELKQTIKAEEEKINEWLKRVMIDGSGWRELTCLGVFSNGEAVYRYTDSLIKKG